MKSIQKIQDTLSNHDDYGNNVINYEKQLFCTLCTCIFQFGTSETRSRSIHDVKWLQLCGRREHMMTKVQFCLFISEALVPV